MFSRLTDVQKATVKRILGCTGYTLRNTIIKNSEDSFYKFNWFSACIETDNLTAGSATDSTHSFFKSTLGVTWAQCEDTKGPQTQSSWLKLLKSDWSQSTLSTYRHICVMYADTSDYQHLSTASLLPRPPVRAKKDALVPASSCSTKLVLFCL